MAWLFERIIELAAWVAFVLCILLFFQSIWLLVHWAKNFKVGVGNDYLMEAGQSAAGFVLCALALGALACIDRYVFDMPEDA